MDRKVEIEKREEVFREFFRIERVHLRHRRFDGTMSEVMTRLNLDRGDSVAALIHDIEDDSILLIEQFRYPTYQEAVAGSGWILELPAGIVRAGEVPEETARRELEEEIGYVVKDLRPLSTFYVSPGGTSERLHLYYATVSADDRASAGGGLAREGEDIRVVRVPARDAVTKICSGEIVDAKTIIALQWLQHQRLAG